MSLPVFIQNILNSVPKTNEAFTGLVRHGGKWLMTKFSFWGGVTLLQKNNVSKLQLRAFYQWWQYQSDVHMIKMYSYSQKVNVHSQVIWVGQHPQAHGKATQNDAATKLSPRPCRGTAADWWCVPVGWGLSPGAAGVEEVRVEAYGVEAHGAETGSRSPHRAVKVSEYACPNSAPSHPWQTALLPQSCCTNHQQNTKHAAFSVEFGG